VAGDDPAAKQFADNPKVSAVEQVFDVVAGVALQGHVLLDAKVGRTCCAP
jgi:hypothetical protein